MRSSLAALAILALASAACEPQRRDVQVNFTFGGQSCAAAGVSSIEIDIGGEIISPNQFACSDTSGNVTTGLDLGRFLVGQYEIEITGYDATGNITYQTDQFIEVRGSANPNVFTLDAPPFSAASGGQGALTLLWTFDGQSCSSAGVSTVEVVIDGQAVTDNSNNAQLACTERRTDGVTIAPLSAGTHAVTVSATGANGVTYSDSLSANIADQFETALSIDLFSGSAPDAGTDGGLPDGGTTDGGPTDGGTTDGGTSDGGTDGGTTNTATAEISWSFAGMSCTAAQVDTVTVYVDGASAGSVPCASSGTNGGTITGISSGSHAISISAVRGSGASAQLVYKTSGAGTTADFQAGTSTHLILSAASASPGVGGAALTLSFPSGGPDCTTTSGPSTQVTYVLTSPAGVAQAPATFACGGAGGASAISICNPGASGCSGSGLTTGVWTISATATGYSASTTPFPVPNDAVGTATVTFSATP